MMKAVKQSPKRPKAKSRISNSSSSNSNSSNHYRSSSSSYRSNSGSNIPSTLRSKSPSSQSNSKSLYPSLFWPFLSYSGIPIGRTYTGNHNNTYPIRNGINANVYARDDGKICACKSKVEWIKNFSKVHKTWTHPKKVGVSNSGTQHLHYAITPVPNSNKVSWQVLNENLVKKVFRQSRPRKKILPGTVATLKFNNRKQYDFMFNGTNWVTPGMNKLEKISFRPVNNRAKKDVYTRDNGKICACQSSQEWVENAFAVSKRLEHNLTRELAENDLQKNTRAIVQNLKENLQWGEAAHEAYGTNLKKNSRYN